MYTAIVFVFVAMIVLTAAGQGDVAADVFRGLWTIVRNLAVGFWQLVRAVVRGVVLLAEMLADTFSAVYRTASDAWHLIPVLAALVAFAITLLIVVLTVALILALLMFVYSKISGESFADVFSAFKALVAAIL